MRCKSQGGGLEAWRDDQVVFENNRRGNARRQNLVERLKMTQVTSNFFSRQRLTGNIRQRSTAAEQFSLKIARFAINAGNALEGYSDPRELRRDRLQSFGTAIKINNINGDIRQHTRKSNRQNSEGLGPILRNAGITTVMYMTCRSDWHAPNRPSPKAPGQRPRAS